MRPASGALRSKSWIGSSRLPPPAVGTVTTSRSAFQGLSSRVRAHASDCM